MSSSDCTNPVLFYFVSSLVNQLFFFLCSIALRSFRCFWLALKTNSKIYHFHDPELIPYAILLRLFGKKVIYDVHEDLPEDIVKKECDKTNKSVEKIKKFFLIKSMMNL